MKKNTKIILGIVIVLVIVAIMIGVIVNSKGKENENLNTANNQATANEVIDGNSLSNKNLVSGETQQ